jgi:hypothetical protein
MRKVDNFEVAAAEEAIQFRPQLIDIVQEGVHCLRIVEEQLSTSA